VNPLRSRLCKRDYSPPFLAKGVKAYAFILHGDADTIRREVVQRTLGPEFGLIPGAENLFVLAWIEYGSLTSVTAPDNERGAFAYKESATFVLVDCQIEGWDQEPAYLYISSLYVDKAAPIITGLETYGFPKSWGDIAMKPQNIDVFMTYANEIHNYILPPEQPRHSIVYKAERTSDSWGGSNVRHIANNESHDPHTFIDRALELLHDEIVGAVKEFESEVKPLETDIIDAVKKIVRHFAVWDPPLVFLKQFPSSQHVGEMCYGSYVRANFRPINVSGLSVLHGYTVRLNEFASAPYASSHGVEAGTDLKPLIGFSVQCDFNLGDGDELLITSNPHNYPVFGAPLAVAESGNGQFRETRDTILGLSGKLAGGYVEFIGEAVDQTAAFTSKIVPKPIGNVVESLGNSIGRASRRLGDGLRRL